MTKYQQNLMFSLANTVLMLAEEAMQDEEFNNKLADIHPPMSLDEWAQEILCTFDEE